MTKKQTTFYIIVNAALLFSCLFSILYTDSSYNNIIIGLFLISNLTKDIVFYLVGFRIENYNYKYMIYIDVSLVVLFAVYIAISTLK